MEAEDVLVLDGMGDGVFVQLALKGVGGGAEGGLVVFDLNAGGVFLEDGRAGEAEELGAGEEVLDGLVVVAELGAVALVEDEDEALVAQRIEALGEGVAAMGGPLLVALAVFVQGEAELLDGGDDDLVRLVIGEHAADESRGVGIFLDAAFLEAVELLARLPVEVLAVHDEEAFVDVFTVLEECGGLEGGKSLAAACGVPDVAVAVVLFDAVDNGLDGVDLVWPHHEQFLLALDEDHVAADHAAECALLEEAVGEVVEVGNGRVIEIGEAIDGEELLGGVEGEVPGVVVGEIEGLGAVADDEELDEAEERAGVAVAGVVLVLDDLLHGAARADSEGLEFNLYDGDAVDEEDDVEAVVAVVGVDAELVDDLEVVLAPVADVDERVGKRGVIVAGEVAFLTKDSAGGEDVGGDEFIEKALELAVCEPDAVKGFELLAKVALESGAVEDVGTIGVLETAQLRDERILDVLFPKNKCFGSRLLRVCSFRGR